MNGADCLCQTYLCSIVYSARSVLVLPISCCWRAMPPFLSSLPHEASWTSTKVYFDGWNVFSCCWAMVELKSAPRLLTFLWQSPVYQKSIWGPIIMVKQLLTLQASQPSSSEKPWCYLASGLHVNSRWTNTASPTGLAGLKAMYSPLNTTALSTPVLGLVFLRNLAEKHVPAHTQKRSRQHPAIM